MIPGAAILNDSYSATIVNVNATENDGSGEAFVTRFVWIRPGDLNLIKI
jgi:hypothetical protein